MQFGLPATRGYGPAYDRIREAERLALSRGVNNDGFPLVNSVDCQKHPSAPPAQVQTEPAKKAWKVPKVYIPSVPRWREVLAPIAAEYGVSVADILGQDRHRRLVVPRQAAMFALVADLGYSLSKTGRIMRRDHTTVLHGIFCHADRRGLPLPRGSKYKGKRA